MKIEGAGIIIENTNGRILAIHRIPSVPEGNKWGIPGGAVLEGQSPIDVAIAKTKDEVGINIKKEQLEFFGHFNYNSEGNTVSFDVWVFKPKNDEVEVKLNEAGQDKYKWETAEKLHSQRDLMEGMYPILEKYIKIK